MAPKSSVNIKTVRALNALLSERMKYASQLGVSFDGKRDMYVSCGYPKALTFENYKQMYSRGDIAKTVITAYPNATWVKPPIIREMEGDSKRDPSSWDDASTPFEQAWKALINDIPIFGNFNRADILCGIGQYGGLFLGFDDGTDLSREVGPDAKLIFTKPLSEANLIISQVERDPINPRYGQPTIYQVNLITDEGIATPVGEASAYVNQTQVHWSRILHLADNRDESEIFGVPRLQTVFNRLQDMDKILGCSAEMFWLGAFQGIAFEADPESVIEDKTAMQNEIESFMHGLQRYLRLQGVTAKVLSSPVASPKTHIDCQMLVLSATTRIPLRILTGSERGELASVQDENNWKDRVDERRRGFATSDMIKPFIQRLIKYGSLPSPKNGPSAFVVEWSDISSTTYKQQMETSRIITDSLRMYIADKIYLLMKPEQFLEKIMKFSPDQIKFFGEFDIENLKKVLGDTPEAAEMKLNPPVAAGQTGDKKNVGNKPRRNGQGAGFDTPQERRIVPTDR